MLGFRGLHIVAGIAAMGVAALLGMVMELNNTAIFTSSCVAYVAASMWTEGRLARRRSQLHGMPPAADSAEPPSGKIAREQSAPEQSAHEQLIHGQAPRESSEQHTHEQRPRETRGGNAA